MLESYLTVFRNAFHDIPIGIQIFDTNDMLIYENPWAQSFSLKLKTENLAVINKNVLTEPVDTNHQKSFHVIVETPNGWTNVYRCNDTTFPDRTTMRTIHAVDLHYFTEDSWRQNLVPTAVLVLDEQLRIVSCNAEVARFMNREPVNLIGKEFAAVIDLIPEFPSVNFDMDYERSLQCKLRYRGNTTRWVEISVRPQVDELGKITQHLIVITDINDLRKSQRDLAHQERLATLGQLAAGLAHEVKNPLTGIKGFLQLTQLYLDRKNTLKLTEYLDNALAETENLQKLINDFLNFAQPHEPEKQKIELIELMEEVSILISSACYLRSISFSLELPDKNITLWGDRHQIKQVVLNIANNGIEAMYESQVRKLTISAYPVAEMCMITIKNTGPEIPEKIMNSIFDPFFTTKEHGTGLGLSTCARLVRENGGHLAVESSPSQTAFNIHVPLYKS